MKLNIEKISGGGHVTPPVSMSVAALLQLLIPATTVTYGTRHDGREGAAETTQIKAHPRHGS
jgi:hypothetical protein